ncbi:hypothetical protein BB561_000689 [Smittium simulii]|uniref:Uncharacterized protein n=1 Tax=Smittium simulii TaxID=133385 RepID=A0A2T9YY04_9FUNG|nr:hypothetical protein BB561_000689 [Smittium simulii]
MIPSLRLRHTALFNLKQNRSKLIQKQPIIKNFIHAIPTQSTNSRFFTPKTYVRNYVSSLTLSQDITRVSIPPVKQNNFPLFLKTWLEINNSLKLKVNDSSANLLQISSWVELYDQQKMNIESLQTNFYNLISKDPNFWQHSLIQFSKAIYFLSAAFNFAKISSSSKDLENKSANNSTLDITLDKEYQEFIATLSNKANFTRENFSSSLLGLTSFIKENNTLFDTIEDDLWMIYFLEAANLNKCIGAVESLLKLLIDKKYQFLTSDLPIEIVKTIYSFEHNLDPQVVHESICNIFSHYLLNEFMKVKAFFSQFLKFIFRKNTGKYFNSFKYIYYDNLKLCDRISDKISVEYKLHSMLSISILKSLSVGNNKYEVILSIYNDEINQKLGSFITNSMNDSMRRLNKYNPQYNTKLYAKLFLYSSISNPYSMRSDTIEAAKFLIKFIKWDQLAAMIYSKSYFLNSNTLKSLYIFLAMNLNISKISNKNNDYMANLSNFKYSDSQIVELSNSLKWNSNRKFNIMSENNTAFDNISNKIYNCLAVHLYSSPISIVCFDEFIKTLFESSPQIVSLRISTFFNFFLISSRIKSNNLTILGFLIAFIKFINQLKKTNIPIDTNYLAAYFYTYFAKLGLYDNTQLPVNFKTYSPKFNNMILLKYITSHAIQQNSHYYLHNTLKNIVSLQKKSMFTLEMDNVNSIESKNKNPNIVEVISIYCKLNQPKIALKIFTDVIEFANKNKNFVIYPFIFNQMLFQISNACLKSNILNANEGFEFISKVIDYSKKIESKAKSYCPPDDIWFYNYAITPEQLKVYIKFFIDSLDLYGAIYTTLFYLPKKYNITLNTYLYVYLINKVYTTGISKGAIDEKLMFFLVASVTNKLLINFSPLIDSSELIPDAKKYLIDNKHRLIFS